MKRLLTAVALLALSLAGAADAQVAGTSLTGDAATPLVSLTNSVVQVGATGRRILDVMVCNNPDSSTIEYVQLFDAATPGAVTLGTTPPKTSIPLNGGQADPSIPLGIQFNAGIQWAATTTPTGNTAPASAVQCAAVFR